MLEGRAQVPRKSPDLLIFSLELRWLIVAPPACEEPYTSLVNPRKGDSLTVQQIFLLGDGSKKPREMRGLPYTDEFADAALGYTD
jgi:hypothetical protein